VTGIQSKGPAAIASPYAVGSVQSFSHICWGLGLLVIAKNSVRYPLPQPSADCPAQNLGAGKRLGHILLQPLSCLR
jgi:hypothetical protein